MAIGICGCINPRPGGCHACNPMGTTFSSPPQFGWRCPRCDSVMSPSMPTCWYCRPVENRSNLREDHPFPLHLSKKDCAHTKWLTGVLGLPLNKKKCLFCGLIEDCEINTLTPTPMNETLALCPHGTPVKFNSCVLCNPRPAGAGDIQECDHEWKERRKFSGFIVRYCKKCGFQE